METAETSMATSEHPYRVYIVRCWEDREAPKDNASRFVLEIPRTGERYGFTSSERLLSALKNQLDITQIATDSPT